MDRIFEESQKLFDEELAWWAQQVTGALERNQEALDRTLKAQAAFATDAAKHGQALVERHVALLRQALSPVVR